MSEGPRGYTGHILEHEVLGPLSAEARRQYERYSVLFSEQTLKFMDIVKVVEMTQRNESIAPTKYFGKNMRKLVAEKLGLDLETDPYAVEFYVSLSTVLDSMGVDAFMRVREPGTKFNAIVSIDVTENPNKETWKADVITYFPHSSLDYTDPQEKQEFDEIIEHCAAEVAEIVNNKKESYFKRAS